jgi:16S rRNA (guanine966-N2)-methyltransferase
MNKKDGGSSPPGRIRIVGGAKRGRRIKVVSEKGVRPTAERVREAIFDALGPVVGLRVLDLFAGTGAMGLEALSRGARSCVFVEHDTRAASVLRDNITALELEPLSTVIQGGYLAAAKRLAMQPVPFDLLFLDPPYRMLAEVEAALTPLLSGLLGEDGVAVVEGPKAFHPSFARVPVFDRLYGDTRVIMICMRRNDP